MKKQSRNFLLTLVMSFFIAGVTCYGAQADVSVTGIYVSDAQALALAAESCEDQDVIVLSGDILSDSGFTLNLWGKTVTLDVNGHALTVTDQLTNAIRINGWNGKLILIDSKGGGKLKAACLYDGFYKADLLDTAAIRVTDTAQTIVFDNITVEADGGAFGPGIGASSAEPGGIIVRNADITATGGVFGAGIGGGYERLAGNIIIEDGLITATGGDFAAAIGTGGFSHLIEPKGENSIVISGGTIRAAGGLNGAGIGGGQLQIVNDIKIEDGKITASGGSYAAAIGSGKMNAGALDESGSGSSKKELSFDGNIFISGGNILATGGNYAAGIGMGEGSPDYKSELRSSLRLIKVDGGNIVARGGLSGAGIGGGAYFSGGNIEIAQTDMSTTYVEASGGTSGAGIGGGLAGLPGAMVRVYDGRVHASGGENAAGIGSGEFAVTRLEPTDKQLQALKNIVITGGQLDITGGKNASAIGGGNCGSGSDVFFSGTPVITAVSDFETTIGGGMYATSQGSVTIDGGNIKINQGMGPMPYNSDNEVLTLSEIEAVYQGSPAAYASMEAKLNGYAYPITANAQGMAYVYLPEQEDDLTVEVFSQPASAVEILSTEYTYFPDGESNTFALSYKGDQGSVTFALGENATDVSINSLTGVLTFPVQLKTGDFTIPIYAYDNGTLKDSVDFKLTVADKMLEIRAEPKFLQMPVNTGDVFTVEAVPANSVISDVFWKVTDGESENCIIQSASQNGEYTAEFSALKPGRYTVTVTATDINNNTASDFIDVLVSEPNLDMFYADNGNTGLFNEEAVTASTQWPTIEDLEIEKLESGVNPAIEAWSIFRPAPNRLQIDFYANKTGEYAYSIVEAGKSATENYLTGFTAKKGVNTFEYTGINGNSAYDIYLKLTDLNGTESPEMKFVVDAYEIPDIIPPQLTAFSIERSPTEAKITFDSSKEGQYTYTVYVNGISEVFADNRNQSWLTGSSDLSWLIGNEDQGTKLNPGENEIFIKDLLGNESYEIYITATDQAGNTTPQYVLGVEAFELDDDDGDFVIIPDSEPDTLSTAMVPELEPISVVRNGAEDVTVTINSNTSGEFYYTIVEEGMEIQAIDLNSKNEFMAEGKNAILLSSLSPQVAYRIGIVAKNETGEFGQALVMQIPAHEPAISLVNENVRRDSDSKTTISFESDKRGTFFYSVVERNGNMPETYSYSDTAFIGINFIVLNDLHDPVDVYVIAVDEAGNYSNQLKIEV